MLHVVFILLIHSHYLHATKCHLHKKHIVFYIKHSRENSKESLGREHILTKGKVIEEIMEQEGKGVKKEKGEEREKIVNAM